MVGQDVPRPLLSPPTLQQPCGLKILSLLHLLNLSHIITYPFHGHVPETVPILFKLVVFFSPAHKHIAAHTHKLLPAVVKHSTENTLKKKKRKSEWRSPHDPMRKGINASHEWLDLPSVFLHTRVPCFIPCSWLTWVGLESLHIVF